MTAPADRPSLAELASDPAGFACRACGCRDFHVVYTRTGPSRVVRRRACRRCGQRITTWEREAGTPPAAMETITRSRGAAESPLGVSAPPRESPAPEKPKPKPKTPRKPRRPT